MKNYEKVTNDLLERRERYVIEQKRKKKKITGIASSICCVSLVFLIGISVWGNKMIAYKNILLGDDKDYSTEKKQNGGTSDKSKIISSYESNFSASYVAPKNGEFGLTEPLRNAINEYGDTVKYMAVINIFRDEKQLSLNKELLETEIKRLETLGYEAFIEENNNGKEILYNLEIQSTAEQILNFNCNREYGYFLFIRSEIFDDNTKTE